MTTKRLPRNLLVFLLIMLVSTLARPSHGADLKVPDFTLPNLEGKDVKLSDLLAKGPVVLDFWATWCKPCLKAFPGLQKISDKYEDRGLRIVAISVDNAKSRARVGPLIKSKKYTFEVLLDTQGRVAQKYQAALLPRTLLVSADGEIVFASVGYRPANHEKLEDALISILPEKAGEDREGDE